MAWPATVEVVPQTDNFLLHGTLITDNVESKAGEIPSGGQVPPATDDVGTTATNDVLLTSIDDTPSAGEIHSNFPTSTHNVSSKSDAISLSDQVSITSEIPPSATDIVELKTGDIPSRGQVPSATDDVVAKTEDIHLSVAAPTTDVPLTTIDDTPPSVPVFN